LPIPTTSGFDTANSKMAKMPIYAFSIPGWTVFTTHDLVRTGITGALPSYLPWLKTPQGSSQSIDIVNGSASIGDLTCEIVDVGGAVRAWVGTNTLEGSMVTLCVGYPGLAWSDFAVVQTYLLYKINPTDGYTSFNFLSKDLGLLLNMTVYTHPENGYLLSEDNPWYLSGTPAEMFQAICLCCLQLTAAQVDRATMATLDSPAQNIFAPWRPFRFALTSPFQAKSFIESQILKPSGCYPVVLPSGALSMRSAHPPVDVTPVFTFTENNLKEFPKWDRQAIVNQAVWKFADGSSEVILEAASIGQYGNGQQFSVDSQGLRPQMAAAAYAQWVTSCLFRRFSGDVNTGAIKGGAPVLTLVAFLLTLPVWVGDYVALTHSKMPDITTGALGVTNRIYEVIDRQPNYAGGFMQYKVLDTGISGAPAPCTIGPGTANPYVIGAGVIY